MDEDTELMGFDELDDNQELESDNEEEEVDIFLQLEDNLDDDRLAIVAVMLNRSERVAHYCNTGHLPGLLDKILWSCFDDYVYREYLEELDLWGLPYLATDRDILLRRIFESYIIDEPNEANGATDNQLSNSGSAVVEASHRKSVYANAMIYDVPIIMYLLEYGDEEEEEELLDKSLLVATALEYGAKLDIEHQGETPLTSAVKHGLPDIVKKMIELKVDVNRESLGGKPVEIAFRNRNEAIVELLIANNASLIDLDLEGESPISISVSNGWNSVVDLMLHRGVEVFEPQGRFSPLFCALSIKSKEIALNLVKHGANVNVSFDNETPLTIATSNKWYALSYAILLHGDLELINRGTPPPLAISMQNGDTELAKLFIEHNAKIDIFIGEETPLTVAINKGWYDIVDMLIHSGANLNATTRLGSPLTIATKNNDVRILELLMIHSADINKLDINKKTPLIVACECDNYDLVERIINYGADVNIGCPIIKAVKGRNDDISELLVLSHAQLDNTALRAVISNKLVKTIDAVVDGLNDINISVEEETLLTLAIEAEFTYLVKLLLIKGIDKHVVTPLGTPLTIAAKKGNLTAVSLLRYYNADVNMQDTEGMTPLFIASELGNLEVVEELLRER